MTEYIGLLHLTVLSGACNFKDNLLKNTRGNKAVVLYPGVCTSFRPCEVKGN